MANQYSETHCHCSPPVCYPEIWLKQQLNVDFSVIFIGYCVCTVIYTRIRRMILRDIWNAMDLHLYLSISLHKWTRFWPENCHHIRISDPFLKIFKWYFFCTCIHLTITFLTKRTGQNMFQTLNGTCYIWIQLQVAIIVFLL